MKKSSLIKGILLVTVMAILMMVSNNVFATSSPITLNPTNDASNGAATNNSATNNSATNNSATNNSALSSTLTPTTNNANKNTNTLNQNLPKTGIADNTVVFIAIGACIFAAVYAYKKVRDYKGI